MDMMTTATIKSLSPNNSLTKIALLISADTKIPLIFLESDNSALDIINQLLVAETNEENISKIKIDGVIHSWTQEVKIAVDAALTEWLGDFLSADDFMSSEYNPTEEDVARWNRMFAEARKPANDPAFIY